MRGIENDSFKIASRLSDFGRIGCKKAKNGLILSIFSLRFPKSDSLLDRMKLEIRECKLAF